MAYTHQQMYQFYLNQGHDSLTANRMAAEVMQAQTQRAMQDIPNPQPIVEQPPPGSDQTAGKVAAGTMGAASTVAAAAPASSALSAGGPWFAAANLAIQGGLALDKHLDAKRAERLAEEERERIRRERDLQESLMAGMPGGGVAGMPGSGTYSSYV